MSNEQRNRKYQHRLLFLCLSLIRANAFQSTLPTTTTATSTATHATKEKVLRIRNGWSSFQLPMVTTDTTPNNKRINNKYRDLDKEIVRLGRSGKTSDALELYSSIDRPSIRNLNSAIDACSRARPTRLEKAKEIFQAGVQEKNLQPNVFTFGALMNACLRARNGDQAMILLRSMQDTYGVAPNSVVYSSAISACARSKPPKPEQALELLREAVEEKEIQMNVVGFNAAISACAQAGDFENAISILNRMEEAVSQGNSTHYLIPAPDFVTYGTILAACERGEQWGLVLKYARSMREHGLELDGIAVTSCLHACQQLGLADEALQYLRTMKSIIVHPTSAKPQTARLQRKGARKPLCGPDAVAYRLAISACARGGSWREGIRLLDEYQKVTGTAADVVAYTSAITGCEYAGQWKEAFYLLNKMRKQGVEPNEVTMAAVIGACATAVANQAKNKDQSEMLEPENENESEFPEAHMKALKLLDILKNHDTLIKPNIQVYNAAIRTCAEAGDMKGAFALFEEIEEANIERTERSYGSLMTACERVGCMEGVSKVFRMMKEDEIMPNEIIYGAAISCCRKAKQSERALLLLRKMMKEDLSPNVATFNTVMVAQAEGRTKGDSERAILVYRLMKSKFASGNGRPNRQTYNILINFFASMYQPLTAESFLKQMRQDGFKPDVDLFTATVAAYERTGQPLKALEIMESMQQNGYDFYGVEVLNSAFKKAVKLVNQVGQSLSSRDESKEERSLKLIHMEQEDDDLMQQDVIN